MNYGDRLKEALAQSNKDRKGLAAAMGITVQAVGGVINGGTKAFTAENNARAAAYLGVNPSWLATGEGSKHPASSMDHFESSVRRLGVQIDRPGNSLQRVAPEWLDVLLPDGQTVRYHPDFVVTRADGTKFFLDFLGLSDLRQGVADQLQKLAAEHPDDLILAPASDALSSDFANRIAKHANAGVPAPAPHEAPSEGGAEPDLVITEYATGGGMDTQGQLLLDDQPGTIKSWRVTKEWLRLNVPSHTGLRNLCIVTGFGPSMRPMFNPGDPLLVDTGVKVVNHEGVYFFRVGEEGFIKLIQRVPEFDGPGFSLRVISKNPDYPPYDISPKNPHFEVLGKVLTVWRSEQY